MDINKFEIKKITTESKGNYQEITLDPVGYPVARDVSMRVLSWTPDGQQKSIDNVLANAKDVYWLDSHEIANAIFHAMPNNPNTVVISQDVSPRSFVDAIVSHSGTAMHHLSYPSGLDGDVKSLQVALAHSGREGVLYPDRHSNITFSSPKTTTLVMMHPGMKFDEMLEACRVHDPYIVREPIDPMAQKNYHEREVNPLKR